MTRNLNSFQRTIRFTAAHAYVVDVVAHAEEVEPSEAIRRIVERYARQIEVGPVHDLPAGALEPDQPTLWHEARTGRECFDPDLDAGWVEIHGDPTL